MNCVYITGHRILIEQPAHYCSCSDYGIISYYCLPQVISELEGSRRRAVVHSWWHCLTMAAFRRGCHKKKSKPPGQKAKVKFKERLSGTWISYFLLVVEII